MSAILENPETLKDAFESANNAAGSALKENEKYLDSIQGRIDVFTNAVQTMWNNAINSDAIKTFVDLGTELVKLIDKVGLLNSLFIALSSYVMIKHKMGPITFFKELIGLIPKGVDGIQKWIQAVQTKDAVTLKGIATKIADTTATTANTAANEANAASSVVAGEAEDKDTIDTVENTAATVTDTLATKENTKTNILNATSNSADIAKAASPAESGGATAFTGLAAAVSKILAAVAIIAGAVMIFKAVTKDINELSEELKEAQAEYDDTKTKIESLNDELKTTKEKIAELQSKPSLSFVEQEELTNLKKQNDQLERTLKLQEMILAQQKSTAIEAAEEYVSASWDGSKWYDKKYNVDPFTGIISEDTWYTVGDDTKYALDTAISKYEQIKQADKMRSDIITGAAGINLEDGNEITYDEYKKLYFAINGSEALATEDEFTYKNAIDSRLSKNDWKELLYDKDWNEEKIKISEGINLVLNDPEYANLSYGLSDDIDKFLDEYYTYVYKWSNAQGLSTKSDTIANIFNDTSSESINKLKEQLEEIGDSSDSEAVKQEKAQKLVLDALEDTTGEYDRLKNSVDILYSESEDKIKDASEEIARYFVKGSLSADSDSIMGIAAQYSNAAEALKKFKDGLTMDGVDIEGLEYQYLFDDLFNLDAATNKWQADAEKVSQILGNADKQTRDQFINYITHIKNAQQEAENAGKEFDITSAFTQAINNIEIDGLLRTIDLTKESLSSINKVTFKDISDNIDGLIDTFDEFGAALENTASAMDTLYKAQQQQASSGRVSIKTALELMQTTDDWGSVLEITGDTIKLQDGAELSLIQTRLDLIEKNIDTALSEAELQYAKLEGADATVLQGDADLIAIQAQKDFDKAMNQSTAVTAGLGAAADVLVEKIKKLTNQDYNSEIANKSIVNTFTLAYDTAVSVLDKQASPETAEELKQKIENLRAEKDMIGQLRKDPSAFKKYYDYDKTPGDKYKDDSASDAFSNAMKYWENRISAKQAEYDQIQNEIDLLEKQGKIAEEEYYQEQIKLENERKSLLEQQKAEAEKYLKVFKEGSDEWWSVASQLNDIEGNLDDVTSSIQDLQDAIDQVHWTIFDEAHERLSDLTGQLSAIRELLSIDEDSFFDDMGNWTEQGVAALGTYLQELNIVQSALDDVNTELSNISLSDFDSEQEYYDRVSELKKQQQDYAKSIADSKKSIVDMYEQQIDAIEEYTLKAVDAYKELIQLKQDELLAERDLYSFKKSTEQSTKNITELERKIASLSGSTAASDIAQRRKLEKD